MNLVSTLRSPASLVGLAQIPAIYARSPMSYELGSSRPLSHHKHVDDLIWYFVFHCAASKQQTDLCHARPSCFSIVVQSCIRPCKTFPHTQSTRRPLQNFLLGVTQHCGSVRLYGLYGLYQPWLLLAAFDCVESACHSLSVIQASLLAFFTPLKMDTTAEQLTVDV